MASPVWYLGPTGDLRPLFCPAPDVEMSMVRFGGIHTSLSGSSVVDVLGLRQKFTFNFRFMAPEDYAWLDAMNQRHVPGPFRLINPMKKNRLTPEGSFSKWAAGTAQGVSLASGSGIRAFDWPSAAGTLNATTSKWTNRSSGAQTARWDEPRRAAVIPGETIVGSIYLKGSTSINPVNIVIDWWNRTSQIGSTSVTAASVTTSWQRFQATGVVPAGAHSARFAVYTSVQAPDLYLGPAQLELGSSATSWELGGGGPMVLIDQLTTTSPRFNMRHSTLTLMEA